MERDMPALEGWAKEPAYNPVQTLSTMIRDGIFKDPDALLVFWSSGQETVLAVGEIWRRAQSLSVGLNGLGIGSSDRIAIQVPNNADGVTALLACCRLGLVIVPLVMSYRARELEFILRQSNVKAIIAPRAIREVDTAQRIASFGEMSALEHIVSIGGSRDDHPQVVPFEELLTSSVTDQEELDGEITQNDPSDTFSIIYTSGTTGGEPKGAIHTHKSFGSEIVSAAEIWVPAGEHRTPLVIFPPGHIAGFAYSLMPIIDGSGAVYMDTWNAEAAASLVERYNVAWTFGTPFHLAALLEVATPGQLKSIRKFGCGGASVPPSLIERADASGIKAFRAYGTTEHPSISSGRSEDSLKIRAYTDGRLMPDVEVRILDDSNVLCDIGQVGEIVTRGPELFSGYLADKHNAEVLHDGWYRTGDLGTLDCEGALTIVDRKKDIIIRGGENISSKEVEDVILQIDGVLAVAVVGWPDERYGERVAAFVQMKSDEPLEMDIVIEHFKKLDVAHFKTPERLVQVDDFKRTAAGKILKVPLRNQAARLAAAEIA